MTETNLDLSVVIVSWNVRGLLKECLDSIIEGLKGLQAEVFVVDNASHDGSPEMVSEEFPSVKLIANDTNLGFGRANNQALQSCRGKYILLINPDTLVPKDAIPNMMAFMERHPSAGLVGPEQRNEFGRVHLGNCVRLRPRELFESLIERLVSLGASQTRILFPQPRRVPILNGGCWLVRLTAFEKIGFFDEDLFMYAEEPDVCSRLRKAGWKIWFLRNVEILHYRRKSIRQRGKHIEYYLFTRSMFTWLRKLWEGAMSPQASK